MQRLSSLTLPLLVFLAAACGGSSDSVGDGGDAGGASHDGGGLDGSLHDGGGLLDGGNIDGGGGDASHLGPAPVPLGSSTDLTAPGAYVILAKTGITNVTGSMITGGNLGLSPAAASFITGFSLIADSTNVFSTSASVVSPAKVYASDYAPPTPTNLTTAVLAMQTAYTDAAGRLLPDFLDLGSGNIGGRTLAPGLYHWGTGVTIPTDVTISGGANDTWIFQITNDLDQSTATHVILAGGAQARNIVWQVAGMATIHANAHFEGVILCQSGITLQTNASLHGRALAQTLVAIDDDAITAP